MKSMRTLEKERWYSTMGIQDAYECLKEHNKWRRGAETDQTDPVKLGVAIDIILHFIERNTK